MQRKGTGKSAMGSAEDLGIDSCSLSASDPSRGLIFQLRATRSPTLRTTKPPRID